MERTYNLRLPREIEAKHGVEFTDSPKNWVLRSGPVAEFLTAMYPPNSRVGVHACNDRKTSLCNLPMSNAETIVSGRAEKVADAVTCKFCQARLINAGVLDPSADHVGAYARDYGRRRPPLWLYEEW